MWVIEGLEGGGFALVNKTHHAMIDGISGADLMPVLLSTDPSVRPAIPHRWYPQPPPTAPGLLVHAACHRASAPLRFATRAATKLARSPRGTSVKLAESLLAIGQTVAMGARPAMTTPFNRAIGSQRRFDWLELDLGAVKHIKNRLGGTVNDVVLTCVAGAVGRFLTLRAVPGHVQRAGPFRAFCPVNLRATSEHGMLGNRVSNVLADLPITENDPVRRLREIARIMKETKSSRQARGTELVERIAEWTSPRLLSGIVRLTANSHPYNLVVTNVPGPQIPLYLLGARMREMYPLVPLFSDQGLGIALFSYDGRIFWGFNADRDLVPDLHDFVEAVADSFTELHTAARLDDERGRVQSDASETATAAQHDGEGRREIEVSH
jgi:WS/DGAT/MGAT family acyltransferase